MTPQDALLAPLAAPQPHPRLADRGFWTGIGRGALAALRLWRQRARTRRQLADLDRRLLDDIGLDPETARREAALPFWRASEKETR